MATGQELLTRMKQLEEEKQWYVDDMWQSIGRFVNPRRELIRDSQRMDDRGARRGKRSYDGTPNSALGIWRDGMQGFIVNESLRWFTSEMSDPNLNSVDEIRFFLQAYDEAMYSAFRGSNFYNILDEYFNDAGSIGTAVVFTEEDIKKHTEVHRVIHPREFFIAENQFGRVDVLFRKFFLTARQALQKFDEDKLNPTTVQNAKDHPEEPTEFIHAVFPNDEPQFEKLNSTNKAFKSVYVQTNAKPQVEDGMIVKEGGFDVFPYSAWRFRKNSDEVYGYSPAADAMIEIYGLNQIGKTLLEAAHMSVNPPRNVPEEMRGNVRMNPKGNNYYSDPNKIITPAATGINFPIGLDREQRLVDLIKDKYRVEFFKAFIGRSGEATATEIIQIKSEQAQLMGPQTGRLTSTEGEGIRGVFNIVADIEDKGGRLPEPPPILQDLIEGQKERGDKRTEIDIRFTGPLPQAQRTLFQLQPIKRGLQNLGEVAVLFPNATDWVDENELVQEVLDGSDFPQRIMRSEADVAELRQARAEAAAARAQQEQLLAAADAYPKVTKSPEEGSPAEAIGNAIG